MPGDECPTQGPWHKNSRIWMAGPPMVFSSHVITVLTLFFATEHLAAALGMMGIVTTTFIAGAKAVNFQERKAG